MGTKAHPGKYDCFASLKPDEPHFILKGSDTLGAPLVRLWALAREHKTDGREWEDTLRRLKLAADGKGPPNTEKTLEASVVSLHMRWYACGLNDGGHARVKTGTPHEEAKGLRRGHCSKCHMDMTEDSSD